MVAVNSYYLPTGTNADTISLRSTFLPSAKTRTEQERDTSAKRFPSRNHWLVAWGSLNENEDVLFEMLPQCISMLEALYAGAQVALDEILN